jgi:YidC/Oxa1 family membrane protein insertase
MNILIAPFVNALFGFYYLLGNLGWSVVVVTVLIRIILLPLLWPSLKSAKKMAALQPRLKKLQEQFGKDKEGLAKAQMQMYKSEGVNPLSGCLPNILQVAVLIIFFSAFNMVTLFADGKGKIEEVNKQLIPAFQINEGFKFSDKFLGVTLSVTPSKIFGAGMSVALIVPLVLLLGSAILQYFSSKLMMPSPKIDKMIVAKTKDKEDDMMSMMRTQSMYLMPLMTVFIGWNFSVGMLLYWFVNSLVMLLQQILALNVDKDK